MLSISGVEAPSFSRPQGAALIRKDSILIGVGIMKRVLVFAPHPDDEIIGVGGTIIKNIACGNEVFVAVVTKGQPPLFREDGVAAVQAATKACHAALGITSTFFLDLPAVMLEEQHRYEINQKILDTVKAASPDEVYIPHVGDMQKDHQIVAEACMVALRPKYRFAPSKIYAYETLSETGWNIPNIQNEFIPNAYVDISEQLEGKLRAMKQCYASQIEAFPAARSLEAIEALARFRGAVMNLKAAEAFMLVREIR